jgi:hypothetical protein
MNLKNILILLVCVVLLLTGCSSDKESKSSEDRASESVPTTESDAKKELSNSSDNSNSVGEKEASSLPAKTNKVIYTAQVYLQVKDIKKTNKKIEEKAVKLGGYMVESQMYLEGEENFSATLTIRIPEKNFNQFLTEVEDLAVKVEQRSVSGSDVSEEYVDLESRLNSKRTVEKRLLEFMGKAETTEDLLKISSDLANVQGEIEEITGRLTYLDNRIAYSTVTLSLNENKVTIPKLENKELNTWEKTKKQFVTSVNFLIAVTSGVVVVIVGNLPIIIVLGLIAGIVYFVIKRRKKPE